MGRSPPTAGQEDCPGAAGAAAPQPLRAAVRLEAIEGPQAPALGWGKALQTGGRRAGEGAPCGVALEPRPDGPGGPGPPTGAPGRMACGQTPGLRGASGPDIRHASEAQGRRGQGEPARLFRPVGAVARWPGPVATAPEVEGELPDVFPGRARTLVMRGGPPRLPPEGARTPQRWEGAGGGGARTRRHTCHGKSCPVRYFPWSQYRTTHVELMVLS